MTISKKSFNIILIKFVLFLLPWHSIYGQNVTIDNLRNSTTPAFSIIEVEPKTVSRPSTPRGLASSLVSSFNENGLKPDLSLEAAPFWLKKRQGITFQQYLNPVGMQGFWQTASISVATKQRKVSETKNEGTQLGIGLRAQILPGKPSSSSKLLIQGLEFETFMSSLLATAKSDAAVTTKEHIKARVNKTIDDIISGTLTNFESGNSRSNNELINYLKINKVKETLNSLIDKEEIKSGEAINQYISRLQDSNFLKAETALKVQESLKYRVGWILEVATASSIGFPANNFGQDVKHDRIGYWGNLTYRFDNGRDEFSFVVRKMASFSDSVSKNNDYGLSYAHTTKDYSVSLEGILRSYELEFDDRNELGEPIRRLEKENTYKIAVNGEYKLSDNVSLTATFGKNFDNALFTSGNLLTLLGLNFGLGQTLSLK